MQPHRAIFTDDGDPDSLAIQRLYDAVFSHSRSSDTQELGRNARVAERRCLRPCMVGPFSNNFACDNRRWPTTIGSYIHTMMAAFAVSIAGVLSFLLQWYVVFALLVVNGLTALFLEIDVWYQLHPAFVISIVIFPLAFTVNSAFLRRERALDHVAMFKASVITLFLLHRDWAHAQTWTTPADFVRLSLALHRAYLAQVAAYLDSVPSAFCCRLAAVYTVVSDLCRLNEVLRTRSTVPPPLLTRVHHIMQVSIQSLEMLRNTRNYRSPFAVRLFSAFGAFGIPIFLTPYFVYLHQTPIIGESLAAGPYIVATVVCLLFAALFEVQTRLELPFDDGVDSVCLEDLVLDWPRTAMVPLAACTHLDSSPAPDTGKQAGIGHSPAAKPPQPPPPPPMGASDADKLLCTQPQCDPSVPVVAMPTATSPFSSTAEAFATPWREAAPPSSAGSPAAAVQPSAIPKRPPARIPRLERTQEDGGVGRATGWRRRRGSLERGIYHAARQPVLMQFGSTTGAAPRLRRGVRSAARPILYHHPVDGMMHVHCVHHQPKALQWLALGMEGVLGASKHAGVPRVAGEPLLHQEPQSHEHRKSHPHQNVAFVDRGGPERGRALYGAEHLYTFSPEVHFRSSKKKARKTASRSASWGGREVSPPSPTSSPLRAASAPPVTMMGGGGDFDHVPVFFPTFCSGDVVSGACVRPVECDGASPRRSHSCQVVHDGCGGAHVCDRTVVHEERDACGVGAGVRCSTALPSYGTRPPIVTVGGMPCGAPLRCEPVLY